MFPYLTQGQSERQRIEYWWEYGPEFGLTYFYLTPQVKRSFMNMVPGDPEATTKDTSCILIQSQGTNLQ